MSVKGKIIGVILLVSLIATATASAEVFKVIIHNPDNYTLENYQIKINLSEYLNSSQYLKVTDSKGNLLKFTYEQPNGECGINPTTVIWVKVPYIPANGNTTIYVKTSNKNYAVKGEDVFDFYDDFNDNNISDWHVKKWGTYNGDVIVDNGKLRLRVFRCYNVEVYKTFPIPPGKYMVEFKWRTKADEWWEGTGWKLYDGNRIIINEHLPMGRAMSKSGVKEKMVAIKNNSAKIVFRIYPSPYCSFFDHYNTYLWIDWIKIRKIADKEPEVTIIIPTIPVIQPASIGLKTDVKAVAPGATFDVKVILNPGLEAVKAMLVNVSYGVEPEITIMPCLGCNESCGCYNGTCICTEVWPPILNSSGVSIVDYETYDVFNFMNTITTGKGYFKFLGIDTQGVSNTVPKVVAKITFKVNESVKPGSVIALIPTTATINGNNVTCNPLFVKVVKEPWQRYDKNGDGKIEDPELINAIMDWLNGKLPDMDLIQIIMKWLGG